MILFVWKLKNEGYTVGNKLITTAITNGEHIETFLWSSSEQKSEWEILQIEKKINEARKDEGISSDAKNMIFE